MNNLYVNILLIYRRHNFVKMYKGFSLTNYLSNACKRIVNIYLKKNRNYIMNNLDSERLETRKFKTQKLNPKCRKVSLNKQKTISIFFDRKN